MTDPTGVHYSGVFGIQMPGMEPFDLVSEWPDDMRYCLACGRYVNANPEIWTNCSCEKPVVWDDETDKITFPNGRPHD